jgi:hypothetical protein
LSSGRALSPSSGLDRRPGQHRPQGGDVGLQRGAVLGRRRHGRAFGHDEIGAHEALQLGVGEGGVGAVGGQDLGRRTPGRGVDEGLAVREQLAHLHLVEQLGIGVGGGGDLAGLGRGWVCASAVAARPSQATEAIRTWRGFTAFLRKADGSSSKRTGKARIGSEGDPIRQQELLGEQPIRRAMWASADPDRVLGAGQKL